MLGFSIFDCSLSWTHYVANVCSKMSYYLYLLGSHRYVIDYNLTKMLLHGIFGVVSFVLLCDSLRPISVEVLCYRDFKECRIVQ